MRTFAAIDFETANNCQTSVCSVGIVVYRNGEKDDEIYSLIKPEPNYYIHTRIHGLTHRHTDGAPTFDKIWQTIAPRIEGLPLVAHNSPFDEGCLRATLRMYQLDYPDYMFHCTCRASRRAFPFLPNHQLHTVAAHCGYNLLNHHHALADADACAHIALQIL